MESRLTFIHTLSPLHAGTGQGIGVIDLPIAREKATNIPYLPGSSVKGTIRDEFNGDDNQDKIFGPEDAGFAGAIQFTDQTLLCLPVRSLAGTFAYVTSPYMLQRLKRDADLSFQIPKPSDDEKCIVAGDALKINTDDVCLEDLDLKVESSDAEWANWIKDKVFANSDWQTHFVERFCIVSDNIFSFLLNTATEVTARIKLDDDTKTTQQGALWYEETLPTESILYGLALAFPNRSTELKPDAIFSALERKISKPLQFGGGATVGRGLCQFRMVALSSGQNTNSGGNQQ